ncbi:MAG: ATP-binding protein [Clostridiaceae bacterium]|nr:ATP-binding protein [Clostridiaceae bacterium]
MKSLEIDIGTTTISAVVVDLHTGEVIKLLYYKNNVIR